MKKSLKLFLAIVFLSVVTLSLFECKKKGDQTYLNYYNKGELYLNQQKNSEALDWFNKSIESNPNFPNSYIMRANAYIELKEYDKAEKDLQKVLKGNYGEYAEDAANYMMFFVYLKQKIHDKAFAYLDKALSRKGKKSQAAIMVLLMVDLGRLDYESL